MSEIVLYRYDGIHCQRDRRNMKDEDMARCIDAVDKLKQAGRTKVLVEEDDENKLASSDANLGKSAKQTAEIVGTSERKIEKYRTVRDHGDPETLAALNAGETIKNEGENIHE